MSAGSLAKIFEQLFEATSAVFDGLPIPREPQLMGYVTSVLDPAVKAARAGAIAAYDRALDTLHMSAAPDAGPVIAGLNTVGMLSDRLSILTVKHWKLKNHYGRPEAAAELHRTQIREMIEALAVARRGFSSFNNKLAKRSVIAEAPSFAAAYYGLQTTNLLLWEAQEMLYTKDIEAAPAEELRAYIDYFGKSNLLRNSFIEHCDSRFWEMAEGGAAGIGGN